MWKRINNAHNRHFRSLRTLLAYGQAQCQWKKKLNRKGKANIEMIVARIIQCGACEKGKRFAFERPVWFSLLCFVFFSLLLLLLVNWLSMGCWSGSLSLTLFTFRYFMHFDKYLPLGHGVWEFCLSHAFHSMRNHIQFTSIVWVVRITFVFAEANCSSFQCWMFSAFFLHLHNGRMAAFFVVECDNEEIL